MTKTFETADSVNGEADAATSTRRILKLEAALADRDAKLREAVDLYEHEKRRLPQALARIEREAKRDREVREQEFLRSFLDVLDDVERAVEVLERATVAPAVREGFEIVAQRFSAKLKEHGVERIACNARFDPNSHEAISTVSVADKNSHGAIVEVVADGYMHGNKLLRPTRVVVGQFH